MTAIEMSNEFDLLYNNVASNQAPGLTEYEKSVFLTKAQIQLLNSYFNPKGNKFQEGFDDSTKRQIDFSNIVKVHKQPSAINDSSITKFDGRSKIFNFPENVLFVLNEQVETDAYSNNDVTKLNVVPINYEAYSVLMQKPYKYPMKRQAWRLMVSPATAQSVTNLDKYTIVELIAPGTLTNYVVRYVKRPNPIVLIDLTDEYETLSIDGVSDVTDCELDESLHEEIVQRAVELAKAAYTGDTNTIISVGNASATNLGVVTSGNNRGGRE